MQIQAKCIRLILPGQMYQAKCIRQNFLLCPTLQRFGSEDIAANNKQ